jgi:hypothetical protein
VFGRRARHGLFSCSNHFRGKLAGTLNSARMAARPGSSAPGGSMMVLMPPA